MNLTEKMWTNQFVRWNVFAMKSHVSEMIKSHFLGQHPQHQRTRINEPRMPDMNSELKYKIVFLSFSRCCCRRRCLWHTRLDDDRIRICVYCSRNQEGNTKYSEYAKPKLVIYRDFKVSVNGAKAVYVHKICLGLAICFVANRTVVDGRMVDVRVSVDCKYI